MFYLIEACVGNLAEVHDQQMHVDRQPEYGKHDNDQYQRTTRLTSSVHSPTVVTSSDDRHVTAA